MAAQFGSMFIGTMAVFSVFAGSLAQAQIPTVDLETHHEELSDAFV